MAAGETISLTLTAVFGVVSSVGVVYQVIEIRQRSRRSSPVVGENAVAMPTFGGVENPRWAPPAEPRQAYPRTEDATVRLGVPPPPPPGPAPAPYPFAQPYTPPPAWQPPQSPAPVAPPAYPYPVMAAGPPIAPRIVSRVRVLFLVLTILLVPGVVLMSYAISIDPDPSISTDGTRYSFVEYTISYLVLSIPLEVFLVVLSRLVGRGRNGARISALVVLLSLGLFCSCFGFLAPIAEFDPAKTALSLTYGFLGLSWFAFGAIAIVVSIMLLQPQSNRYFRETTQWLSARRIRATPRG